jgi:hypothetical protein
VEARRREEASGEIGDRVRERTVEAVGKGGDRGTCTGPNRGGDQALEVVLAWDHYLLTREEGRGEGGGEQIHGDMGTETTEWRTN